MNSVNDNVTKKMSIVGKVSQSSSVNGYIREGSLLGGTTDYEKLSNKPRINDIELSRNKNSEELGLQDAFSIGHALKMDEDSGNTTLRVDVADVIEKDNTRPITSAAVYVTVGNIDSILKTI